MEISRIVIITLWSIISLLLIVEYGPICKDLIIKDKLIVLFIFILGGPILVAANILQTILNMILPEGWDNDDDFKGY